MVVLLRFQSDAKITTSSLLVGWQAEFLGVLAYYCIDFHGTAEVCRVKEIKGC